MVRRRISAVSLFVVLGLLGAATEASALHLVDKKSPKNRERPRRARTDYIVLHTTEGAPKGALHKLRKNGEAHYLVNRDGTVYRIVDKDRVAFHAGRSMWDGVANLDRRSVGIEVVGYHHKTLKKRQLTALKELVRQLREIYDVPADHVLTHAQVAYGRPNRYHRYDHRGRKRCAMNLGTAEVREALGLGEGPDRDPDVDAGRLRVADKKLFARLFPDVALTARGRPAKTRRARAAIAKAKAKAKAAADRIAQAVVAKPEPAKAEPEPVVAEAEPAEAPAAASPSDLLAEAKDALSKVGGKDTAPETEAPAEASPLDAAVAKLSALADAVRAEPEAAEPAPAPAVVEVERRSHEPKKARARGRAPASRGPSGLCQISRARAPARKLAGARYAASTTIYILPDGRVRTGKDLARSQAHLLDALPEGTKVLAGKTFGGYVKPSRAPSEICGASWRSNETVYRFPNGKLASGDTVDPARLPKATLVFCAS